MAKKISKRIKVMITGGKATPAAPLGPALGQAGINIGEFVTKFNAVSQAFAGETVTAKINVYEDRSFDFRVVTPPASGLIKEAAGVEKGSGKNTVTKAGSITKAQAREIAERKLADLTAHDSNAAAKIIEGTARSMGIDVK